LSFNVQGVVQRSPFESDTVAPIGEVSTVQAWLDPRVMVAHPPKHRDAHRIRTTAEMDFRFINVPLNSSMEPSQPDGDLQQGQ
jgi:hypothetical protein